MSTVRELHRKAMDTAPLPWTWDALPTDVKREVFAKACDFEEQAARMLKVDPGSEPTRSILSRSAGWMAYHAGDWERALTLARDGLAGFPPARVHGELISLRLAVGRARKKEQQGETAP